MPRASRSSHAAGHAAIRPSGSHTRPSTAVMHPSENARLNSGRASRFVSGAASEIDRKYHAASGSVKASAPSVAASDAQIARSSRAGSGWRSRRAATRSRPSSQPVKPPENSCSPATAANDSCRPTFAMARGFGRSSRSRAKHREVGPSFSRPSSGASSSTAFMTTARVTEGRKPSMAAKKTITAMPTPAVSLLRRRHSRRTTPSSSVTCMPETATMWEMPASDMAVCRA